ncbi:hypothetical protein ASG32_08220 [Methylobacterium sp. Leaf361]|uniref:hypothetical protein n=1 Tax=Methylobacterium sp. Leaf361 TaxID=1736352 RepID=UPI0006FE74DF|nr:hypothetical protein [Methylobacterium sp. Leaf361]KQS75073.1 hypothetical protein ASG32_08220 [Methylobacterium sp. Leaf361]
MTDAIARALAAAETAAAETPTQTASVPAAAPAASVPAAAPAAPRSLMQFMESASMNVEVYLSVSDLGIRFGKDKQLHDAVEVEMAFKDAKAGFVLRVNTPSGVQYLTSWDGVTEARSRQNWSAVIADAKKMDGNSYPSDLIELPVRLLSDYSRKEGGPLAAGTVVGLSLSYMNAKAFGAFLKEQFPKVGTDTPFKVRLIAVPKKGSGQDYGVFGYEVIDEAGAKGGKKAA